jgi:cold shock CspA family protein
VDVLEAWANIPERDRGGASTTAGWRQLPPDQRRLPPGLVPATFHGRHALAVKRSGSPVKRPGSSAKSAGAKAKAAEKKRAAAATAAKLMDLQAAQVSLTAQEARIGQQDVEDDRLLSRVRVAVHSMANSHARRAALRHIETFKTGLVDLEAASHTADPRSGVTLAAAKGARALKRAGNDMSKSYKTAVRDATNKLKGQNREASFQRQHGAGRAQDRHSKAKHQHSAQHHARQAPRQAEMDCRANAGRTAAKAAQLAEGTQAGETAVERELDGAHVGREVEEAAAREDGQSESAGRPDGESRGNTGESNGHAASEWGTVKNFLVDKGYGFIDRSDGTAIFFHKTAYKKGFEPAAGVQVAFKLGESRGKPCAVNVRPSNVRPSASNRASRRGQSQTSGAHSGVAEPEIRRSAATSDLSRSERRSRSRSRHRSRSRSRSTERGLEGAGGRRTRHRSDGGDRGRSPATLVPNNQGGFSIGRNGR